MRRILNTLVACLALSVSLGVMSPHPASADVERFTDARCDVGKYDWYKDELISDACRKADILWAEIPNSSNAVIATFVADDLDYYLKANEKQLIWLNTDADYAPEFRIAAYRSDYEGTVGRLDRVASWADTGTAVTCDGLKINVSGGSDGLRASIPRTCLGRFTRVKMSARSIDRFHQDKSWATDSFPAPRRWSPAVARS